LLVIAVSRRQVTGASIRSSRPAHSRACPVLACAKRRSISWSASARLEIGPKIVQAQLGHANIHVTLDTYSHVIPQMGAEATRNIEEAYGMA
jgi:integrase